MKTLYDLLGVDRRATLSDIQQGYRNHLNEHIVQYGNRPLRRREQARLQKIRDAYLVLSSPMRRYEYDQRLEEMQQTLERIVHMGSIVLGGVLLTTGLLLIGSAYYKPQKNQARVELKTRAVCSESPAQSMAGLCRTGADGSSGH